MEIVYAQEPFPKVGHSSLFLAGPTPRSPTVRSWRPEALRYLEERGYEGTVYVPESRDGKWQRSYDDQVVWEESALHRSDVILFWVPRDLKDMPALTTNDEWGYWKNSGKVVFGAPPHADKVRYQRHYAVQYRVPQSDTLEGTVQAALRHLKVLGAPAARSFGELTVPVHVWSNATFRRWYQSLQMAGNHLEEARVEYVRWTPDRQRPWLWSLWAKVWIEDEQRFKNNEVLIGRPDVSTMVLHGPVNRMRIRDTEIVLVREFRTAGANPTGYVWEPPGGSSNTEANSGRVALEEVYEETGVRLSSERVGKGEARQLLATLSCHSAHLHSMEITPEEIQKFRAQGGRAHGLIGDTERTYVEVFTLGTLMADAGLDWSSVGVILTAVLRAGGQL